MSANAETRERVILDRLKETYEQQGYEFFAYPPRELVPPFLGDFRPDAIALKTGEGIIIEVKSRRRGGQEPGLAEIAELVSAQSNWQFMVFFEEDRPEDVVRIVRSTSAQISAQVDEIQRLASSGHYRAAFMLGWAALEAIARAIMATQGVSSERPYSPLQAIQSLEMNGFLDSNAARHLQAKAKLRDAAVHGDFSVEIDSESVEFLIQQLRALASSLK